MLIVIGADYLMKITMTPRDLATFASLLNRDGQEIKSGRVGQLKGWKTIKREYIKNVLIYTFYKIG